jgi:hypothetical protein
MEILLMCSELCVCIQKYGSVDGYIKTSKPKKYIRSFRDITGVQYVSTIVAYNSSTSDTYRCYKNNI